MFEPSILGKQMLMARRLIEAGAGFVTVQSAGWDMHADGNNPGIKAGMEMLGRPVDRALSAFLDDLEQRGLSDKVLVVLTGDFGRTPKINIRGGRDHWANLCTLGLWGGGLKMGQVIGKSDRNNAVPATTPYSTPNLLSTVMHTLFDVGVLRITRGAPNNLVKLIEDHKPIEELDISGNCGQVSCRFRGEGSRALTRTTEKPGRGNRASEGRRKVPARRPNSTGRASRG